jgi:predicted PhzF superfamily epimerase YddE/YHI9
VAQNQDDLLVELATAARVVALRPDLSRLGALPVRGVIVTAPSNDRRWDFVSRFFAPRVGVDEDPVTGSAHCALAPFWAAKLGRDQLRGRQVSARGGTVVTQVRGERVTLCGRAVTVVRGQLLA